MDLSSVLDRLHKYGQKATYSAVGGIVGSPARSVMHGQPKSHRNTWVVAKKDRQPTGYTSAERDPRLQPAANPLASPEELLTWLKAYP